MELITLARNLFGLAPQPQGELEDAAKVIVRAPAFAPPQRRAPVALQRDPTIEAFIAFRLETVPGATIRSSPVYEAWRHYCEALGISPGSQKLFCLKMQACGIAYDRRNNRPRYLNVGLKPVKHPPAMTAHPLRNAA